MADAMIQADLPMSYNPIVATLCSLKSFFFNGLQ